VSRRIIGSSQLGVKRVDKSGLDMFERKDIARLADKVVCICSACI